MSLLISIIGILVTIFFVIGTHESAHFIAARLLGVKVLRFSIGFGKALFRWHDKSGTEYVLALIPLGGYVKMLDETEGKVPVSELPLAFNRQPFYKKSIIVLAGPLCNLFCALVLYWAIFTMGYVTIKPMIGDVSPRSIAGEARMVPHQQIISIDKKTTSSWTSILMHLMIHLGDQDRITIQTMADNKPYHYVLDLSNWHINELNPDPLKSLGITPYEPTLPLVIGLIAEGSAAAKSSLALGDRIIAINNKKIDDWDKIIDIVYKHPDTAITIDVQRGDHLVTIPLTIGHKRNILLQTHGSLGIGPKFDYPKDLLQTIQYSPLEAIPHAWQELRDLTRFNLILFGKMVTGKLSLQSLGGPITIFETAGDALNSGFIAFISFLAFLSVSLGIINLMPIPGLDGGHLLLQFIEWVTRHKIPERYIEILFRLGFLFILFILIKALTNDILRIYL